MIKLLFAIIIGLVLGYFGYQTAFAQFSETTAGFYPVETLKAPYGAWLDVQTLEHRYYNEDKEFYENVLDIQLLQAQLEIEEKKSMEEVWIQSAND